MLLFAGIFLLYAVSEVVRNIVCRLQPSASRVVLGLSLTAVLVSLYFELTPLMNGQGTTLGLLLGFGLPLFVFAGAALGHLDRRLRR